MTPAEILKAARQKITPPEAWTKNASARNQQGGCDFADSGAAVSWCSLGAIWAVSTRGSHLAENYLVKVTNTETTRFNDDPSRTHAEVLAAFDRAIALAEAEEAA